MREPDSPVRPETSAFDADSCHLETIVIDLGSLSQFEVVAPVSLEPQRLS